VTLPAHAPWKLLGDCLVGLVGGAGKDAADGWPPELRPMPGPRLLAAVRWADSPVGPYLQLTVAQPARLGVRPGLCSTTTVVNSTDARVGGIVNWGFPAELGTLEWSPTADGAELRWKERDITVRGRLLGRRALPLLIPMRSVQHRADGPVVIPGRCRGWARRARLSVEVGDEDDPLRPMAGSHRGMHVGGLRVVVDPARHPAGLTSSLRAPLRAPEPALSSRGD